MQRQNDGILPPFPIWDDVQTFDGHAWRGRVDVVSGGFPCQDISAAGKGAGIDGSRSGMWFHMARIIGEVRPRHVLVENSPMLTSRGLGQVLGDLATLGYDAEWGVLGAVNAGAPHKRDRIWIVATDAAGVAGNQLRAECAEQLGQAGIADGCHAMADSVLSNVSTGDNRRGEQVAFNGAEVRVELGSSSEDVADACEVGFQKSAHLKKLGRNRFSISNNAGRGNEWEHTTEKWWATEPDVGRVAHGVAARVDRLKAIGNGQVSAVVRLAWETIAKGTI
jgi:DNA (cytosine-5)-methyltransferase 1